LFVFVEMSSLESADGDAARAAFVTWSLRDDESALVSTRGRKGHGERGGEMSTLGQQKWFPAERAPLLGWIRVGARQGKGLDGRKSNGCP